MKYILNEDDQEPAMRYEGIARHAFNCDRLEDPHSIADASFFDGEFIEYLTPTGFNAMNIILNQLIKIETSSYKIGQLKMIKESLSIGMEQENSIHLLDYILKIIKEDAD